jgi:hypothetical protein
LKADISKRQLTAVSSQSLHVHVGRFFKKHGRLFSVQLLLGSSEQTQAPQRTAQQQYTAFGIGIVCNTNL